MAGTGRRVLGALALAGLVAAGAPGSIAAAQDTGSTARKARFMEDLMRGGPGIGGDFALTDTAGARRTLAAFRGRIVLLYFGYTQCPDICPTDLYAITQAVAALGPQGAQIQPIFVTLDPARDTPRNLAIYVTNFDSRLLALTGSEAEIRRVADSYRVFYEKVLRGGPDDYLLDHSAFIYLIGRDGRYLGFFPPGGGPERLVEALRPLLAAAP